MGIDRENAMRENFKLLYKRKEPQEVIRNQYNYCVAISKIANVWVKAESKKEADEKLLPYIKAVHPDMDVTDVKYLGEGQWDDYDERWE